ncbi:MAG: carbamoyltransferase HypF [Bacteroidota bacterium]
MNKRLHLTIRGAVQGVGFRPFIYRLAVQMGLTGWVNNSSGGVFIEVEGLKHDLDSFLLKISVEKPPRAFIQSIESRFLDPKGFTSFNIIESTSEGTISALVLPDIATCPDCLDEIFDSTNRRYLYPFTNCTNCGPRFTIIEALPYDRSNTTMKKFHLCNICRSEYENPADRRFHAEPNACPICGPSLELWDDCGTKIARRDEAVMETVKAIRSGKIVAVKGIGGFHLICDAESNNTVLKLRQRKQREEKPFALLYPDLEQVKRDCEVSDLEARLLTSPESPIVLLKKKREASQHISENIAPGNPNLGIMLPSSPLHHILMKTLRFPVIATSGNLSDEPICIDGREAVKRLKGIADLFLTHNRPILRHVDDSITRVILESEQVLRRARGYAPLPVHLNDDSNTGSSNHIYPSVLALGGHLKNTIALTAENNVFISQHIGDLENHESFDAFEHVIKSFKNLYRSEPEQIITDLHPEYLSSTYGLLLTDHPYAVQHHYAHIASCMAENGLDGRVLGVSWDGTGYGTDGTIWGGEFLLTDNTSFSRVATIRDFHLPGGDKAIREPRRTAIGLLYEMMGDRVFLRDDLIPLTVCSAGERDMFQQILKKNINSPVTSSAGRLFDAVASLLGLCQTSTYEGQAGMALEFAIGDTSTDEVYPFELHAKEMFSYNKNVCHTLVVDWEKIILGINEDMAKGRKISLISAKFHNSLSAIILAVAKKIGEPRIVLSGGCFQNRYLTERTNQLLINEGFHPYWHQRIPPNDGGIALGQVYAYYRMKSEHKPISINQPNMMETIK